MRTLIFKRITAIVFFILIILGSSIPGGKIPYVFQLTPDKLIHCVEYMIMGFLIVRWVAAEFSSSSWAKVILLTLVIGALCGMTDELYQHLTPNRTPDFYDWCLDFTGVGLSIPAFSFWRKKIFI